MTTPNQPEPDSIQTMLGQGAYQVDPGGAPGTKFGQGVDETTVDTLFKIPSPTSDNQVDVFTQALHLLPGDALKSFKPFVPAWLDDDDPDAVDKIVGTMGPNAFQQFIDAIMAGFQNQPQGTWTIPALDSVFQLGTDKSTELSNIAAGLAQLKADFAANNNSGKSFQVNVSDWGTSIPSQFTKFIESGTGAVSNDGNTLEYTGGDGLELFLYNVEPLATDYFEVSAIVPRATREFFLSSGNNRLFLVGRSNEDMSSFCFIQFGYYTARFGCVRDGISDIEHPEFFGPPQAINASGYVTFRGGVAGDDNFFQLLVNNQIVGGGNDVANISFIGEDYRAVGLGIEAESFPNGVLVGNVSHFTANDNKPADIAGSGAIMTRNSTGLFTAAVGVNQLIGGFFDNIERASKDIAVNITNGTFTVSEDDWYTVDAGIKAGSGWPDLCQIVLFKNGAPLRYGQDIGRVANAAFTSLLSPRGIAGSWSEYLVAGDVVSVGYDAFGIIATPNSFTGEATGAKTFFTITRGKK